MSIISDVKEVADLVKQLGNIDLHRRILDLQSEIVELMQENLSLKEKNGHLEASLRMRDELKFKKPFYFKDGDDVPFCPQCWEAKQALIHLNGPNHNRDGSEYYYCNNCSKSFGLVPHRPHSVSGSG
jgi:regulator of replication initiation timing